MRSKNIVLFLLVFNFAFISSIKSQINGIISLGETFRTVPNGYSDLWGTSLALGVELKSKVHLTMGYEHFIELFTDGQPSNRHYHFLRLNSKIYFLSSVRFFRPIIKLSIGSELKVNQWGRYDSPLDFSIDKDHFYPNLAKLSNSTNIYYSTPLLTDIQAGISFFSTSHFRVCTMLGYGLRMMTYKQIEYDSSVNLEEIKEVLNQKTMQYNFSHLLSFQVSITFSIPSIKTN